MKKFAAIVPLLALLLGGVRAQAQVAESAEWASRIKAEGLGLSQVEELAQFMTDYVGSRLTASRQKRRADSLMLGKLAEIGLSNPRSAYATEFTRGGWDVVKTYAAMTAPYYCAFTVNPRAWSGSTDGLVKGECIVFDVQTKEDLEKYRERSPARFFSSLPRGRSKSISSRWLPAMTRRNWRPSPGTTGPRRAAAAMEAG